MEGGCDPEGNWLGTGAHMSDFGVSSITDDAADDDEDGAAGFVADDDWFAAGAGADDDADDAEGCNEDDAEGCDEDDAAALALAAAVNLPFKSSVSNIG